MFLRFCIAHDAMRCENVICIFKICPAAWADKFHVLSNNDSD